jgi:SEL1 protein
MQTVEKKDWSLSEWITNFIKDDHPYYHDADYEEVLASHGDPMPGGDADGFYDDDDGIIESFIIIGLAATLVFLVYYRQQRQLQHRQGQAARAQQAGQPVPQGAGEDRGVFPDPNDPAFAQWAAGGVGH